MRIGMICFTPGGMQVCRGLLKEFRDEGDDCLAYGPPRLLSSADQEEEILPQTLSLAQWSQRMFEEGRGMVFIGAAGIAVRAVSPWVKDKLSDPPVVVVDEKMQFAIPLLSGHVGGANELARKISAWTGAVPVITTATDVNRCFAADVFAAENHLAITDRKEAKAVSAALLEGKPVGFFNDFQKEDRWLPKGCTERWEEQNIWITVKDENASCPGKEEKDKSSCLRLVPRAVVVGIGCKKNTDGERLRIRVLEILKEYGIDPRAVKAVATIDIKKEEPAIRELRNFFDCELLFYDADCLREVKGIFSESSFVEQTVGVGNVCERAAMAAMTPMAPMTLMTSITPMARGGRLLIHKQAGEGITVAAAVEEDIGFKIDPELRIPSVYKRVSPCTLRVERPDEI